MKKKRKATEPIKVIIDVHVHHHDLLDLTYKTLFCATICLLILATWLG